MNGVAGDVPLEDAIGMAGMLVLLGRAVPPHLWIDDLVEAGRARALDTLF